MISVVVGSWFLIVSIVLIPIAIFCNIFFNLRAERDVHQLLHLNSYRRSLYSRGFFQCNIIIFSRKSDEFSFAGIYIKLMGAKVIFDICNVLL